MVIGRWQADRRGLAAPLRRFSLGSSLRLRVWAALLLVFCAALAQTAVSLWGIDGVARMTARSTESRRQLDLYQQLDIEVRNYFHVGVFLDDAEPPQDVRTRINALLDQLSKSEDVEDRMVKAGAGIANEASESDRLGEVIRLTHLLIDKDMDASVNGSMNSVFLQQIHPLLVRTISAERQEVNANERELEIFRRRLFVLGVASVLAALVVAVYFSISVGRAVLRPVERITSCLRDLEAGDLAKRIQLSFYDEFNDIGDSINRMAQKLEIKQDKLLELNAYLERIVQDRTAELKRNNAELKKIDDDRKRFFADVSHELRTPLTTIAAEAEITRMIANGDIVAYDAALETILAQAGFLRRRIDDLLAIARSEHGKLVLEKTSVDLRIIAREAVQDVGGLLKASQLTAHIEQCEAPAEIEGDSRWLRQCIVTLLDNAIKFSRPGGSIDISVAVDDSRAFLNVRDYGEGVTTANLPLLFERFYQTETGQRQGGTGIGLSIARWIVEEHGGRIIATNEQRGVTIRVILPRARDS